MSFIHLHLHSQYSLLDGAIKIDELLERCKNLGMNAVAITDHGNMFGAYEFYTKAKKAGIKPILGCEVYVAPRSRFVKESREMYHMTLLCESFEGYLNLCKIMSEAYRTGFYYKPRVDARLLRRYSKGIIALSGCVGGAVAQAIVRDDYEMAKKIARFQAKTFPGSYYIELQYNGLEIQRKANRGLLKLAKELDLPLVATSDCHYLTSLDAEAHEVLLAIQTRTTIQDPDRFRFETDKFYMRTPDEMEHIFKDLPEALENTQRIADLCNVELPFSQEDYQFPPFDGTHDTLTAHASTGLFKRGLNHNREYVDRLQRELHLIDQMGFSTYFLIVADLIQWSKSNGVPVGPGRGSAAGSLVAYALGITDIDPLKYDLLFERFLNPDRINMPDIDMDFGIYGRERVLEYARQKYGAENVAQIITFGTLHAKGAVRDVGRALGYEYERVDGLAKLMPTSYKPEEQTLDWALEHTPELCKALEENEDYQKIWRMAKRLEGLAR